MTPIPQLHALYVTLTGMDIRLDPSREYDWFQWTQAGFTADDLQLLVAEIKRGIRDQTRRPAALKFRNLIGDLQRFEEDLAEARARARAFRPDPARASVLRSTGRPAADASPAPAPARTAEQILADNKAFEQFRSLKNKL
ncbi:MAG: hypothetical protein LLG03_12715 [Planctomycetaceae bacterium]|nr:hypothetical protein [Planctomycetaceae bacterium]